MARWPLSEQLDLRGIPADARVTLFRPGSSKRAPVFKRATGPIKHAQPLTVDDAVDGWVEGRVEALFEWVGGSRAPASHRLRSAPSVKPPVRRLERGAVVDHIVGVRSEKRFQPLPRRGTRVSAFSHLSAMPRIPVVQRLRPDAVSAFTHISAMVAELPQAVGPAPDTVVIGIADLDLVVASITSMLSPLTMDDSVRDPGIVSTIPEFGWDEDRGTFIWDPAGVDPGQQATLFLNPYTLNIALEAR